MRREIVHGRERVSRIPLRTLSERFLYFINYVNPQEDLENLEGPDEMFAQAPFISEEYFPLYHEMKELLEAHCPGSKSFLNDLLERYETLLLHMDDMQNLEDENQRDDESRYDDDFMTFCRLTGSSEKDFYKVGTIFGRRGAKRYERRGYSEGLLQLDRLRQGKSPLGNTTVTLEQQIAKMKRWYGDYVALYHQEPPSSINY